MASLFGASWKTSASGLMIAAGYVVQALGHPEIGDTLKGLGAAILGLSARDNTVSTEQAKAVPALAKL